MIPAKIDVSKSLIIGIDCSGESFSVAVVKDGQCLSERGGFSPRSHLRRLFPAIKGCLEDVGANFKGVAAVAVTNGPGSFTGLRLGVVTARTIAQACGCALVGVNTLEALAAGHVGHKCLLAGLDARRGEIFAAFFDTSKGEIRRLCEDKAYTPEELLQKTKELQCRVAVGSGPWHYADKLRSGNGDLSIGGAWEAQVSGALTAILGERLYLTGHRKSMTELAPFYLRSAEVQVS